MVYYNAKGQQIKQVTPGGMILLAEYDDLGRISKSAIDMNRNGAIDAADIVSENQYAYSTYGGKDVAVRTSVVSQGAQSKTVSVDYSSLDGLDNWNVRDGRIDHASTVYPSPRDGAKTVTATRYDGSKTVSYYQNGRVIRAESFNTDNSAGNTVDYVYDGFNRPVTVTEKFGSTVINTRETVYDAVDQPVTVTENGRATTYIYDNMGRLTSSTLPGNRVVNYEYFPTGEPKKVYGAENYTQTFTWNDFGNKASMSTYRSGNTADTTTWTYNNRNFMTGKTYADGKSVSYTYDADGHLLSRLWARGVTTSYAYDNAGRQTGISYSDDTPGLNFAYDFLNRLTDVTDGTGTHTYAYNADSTLASETIPNIVNSNLAYSYDSFGRRTGMTLNQNNSAVITNSYTYDVQGRIATVGDGTNTATYSRVPGTNLLSSTTIANSGVTKLTTTRNYDSLYRLTGISSTSGVVTKAYSYSYDIKDRRTQLNMPDGSSWVYGYDDNGQIISGVKHDATGKAIPGQSFGYAYDGIGNLTSEQRGVASMNIAYTANNVNQYTQRTIPGLAPVVGEADPTAAVKAIRTDIRDPGYADTMIVPARDGKYFSGILRNVANTAAPVNVTYDVYAVKDQGNQQLINKQSGTYLVAKTPQPFAYDNDHNMLSNRSWTYTYNAENRPVTAVNASNTAKLEYAYDYDGRRVSKKIYAKSGGTWTLTQEIKFVYDGNNLIVEYDGNNTVLRHLWGIDLSGTMDGAGGAGGLLCVTDGTDTYYPAYDGNGNICAYANTTGALAAEYEYSPFGKPAASGAKAADLPFQFSTQYYDKETGTLHYKYREYELDIMRWTTQDPMGEEGGVNLYGFVGNNPVNSTDALGLDFIAIGDRRVDNSLGLAYHYSIQCWKCGCDNFKPLNFAQGFSEEEIKQKCGGNAKKLFSYELMPLDAKVWKIQSSSIYISGGMPAPQVIRKWAQVDVKISFVQKGDEATKIMPIKTGKPEEIKKYWQGVERFANSYPYAELFFTEIKNWPRSLYAATGNNSNTYIRWLATQAGLNMTEMSGYHQGNDWPTQPTLYEGYVAGQKPWNALWNPPPKPTSPLN